MRLTSFCLPTEPDVGFIIFQALGPAEEQGQDELREAEQSPSLLQRRKHSRKFIFSSNLLLGLTNDSLLGVVDGNRTGTSAFGTWEPQLIHSCPILARLLFSIFLIDYTISFI